MRANSRKTKNTGARKGKSLLEKLLVELFPESPISVNFDDLSGVTFDLPELNISYSWRIHPKAFCMLAKEGEVGKRACSQNKFLANRKAIRGRCGFSGMCHMGLTDYVEPWIYRGRVLGVFYVGSVIRAGTEKKAGVLLQAYLEKKRFSYSSAKKIWEEFEKVPRVDVKVLRETVEKVRLVMEVMSRIVGASGILLERYRTSRTVGEAVARMEQSLTTQKAIHYIRAHFDQPLLLADVARAIPCHPHTLCRTFKKETGLGFADYIHRVRVERGADLLRQKNLSYGEIAFRVGFQTQSHFNRIFKKITGKTPTKYRSELNDRR